MSDQPPDRRFEMSIGIDATPEEVWNALTKAEELMRWFPTKAIVEPGAGGSMRWSWDEAWSWVMRIDAWDPPRRLRLVDENARPIDADGKPIVDAEKAAPTRVTLEITLETAAGGTTLRLVHSGFGRGASWDDEIDGVSTGWQFELRSLQHYLVNARGRDRRVAHARGSAALAADAVWAKLLDVIRVTAPRLEAGQPFAADLPTGDRFSGTIQLSIPTREFSGIAAELGDGIFRICSYPASGRTGFTVWAASYSRDAQTMKSLETRVQKMLDDAFAKAG